MLLVPDQMEADRAGASFDLEQQTPTSLSNTPVRKVGVRFCRCAAGDRRAYFFDRIADTHFLVGHYGAESGCPVIVWRILNLIRNGNGVTVIDMKSAYELAMERFKDEGNEVRRLTEEQKQALAEIDRKFHAKIAEKEVFLTKQIDQARRDGDAEALEQLEKQLRNERLRLRDEMEVAKEKIRAE